MLRLGIDVGGTNTDAVLLRDTTFLGSAKVPTTTDVLSGIQQAVTRVLKVAAIDPGAVALSCLGTTHFINAIIRRRGLARVAVLRLCGPATVALPPFCDMPPELCQATGGSYHLLSGGYEYDGGTEIAPVDEAEVRAAVRRELAGGVTSFVVSGVFSPVNAAQEERVGRIVEDELERARPAAGSAAGVPPPCYATLSHEVGGLGLLERENAACLNAALRPLAAALIPAFTAALAAAGVRGALFLTSNDGTLLPAEAAQKLPIATLQSGPVNSLRGAAFLSGIDHGIVVDIGGTTTDLGVLEGGLPRPARAAISIAGVRTNFPSPDLLSIGDAPAARGLGGGSHVMWENLGCSVGPQSVGHELETKALAAGGSVCTATDIAVVLGEMEFGRRELAFAGVGKKERAQLVWTEMQRRLAHSVGRMKAAKGDVPVIVVGGGASLCANELKGASTVVRPKHAAVANAMGAAVPQVSGVAEGVYSFGPNGEQRPQILAELEASATEKAVRSGAAPSRCQVVSKEEVPLAYLPGGVTRARIRVVGDLAELQPPPRVARSLPAAGAETSLYLPTGSAADRQPGTTAGERSTAQSSEAAGGSGERAAGHHDPQEETSWEPQLDSDGAWIISSRDVDALAIGCGILGAGGGGSSHLGRLKVLRELARGAVIRVISPSAVPGQALVAEAGGMGAPTVGLEKLDAFETEPALMAHQAAAHGGELFGVLSCEIGGGNGLESLALGARLGLPVVDADLMGRAFPELQMMTSAIYGHSLTPAVLADEKGNVVTVQRCASPKSLESLLRPVCTAMGCAAGLSTAPLTGAELRCVGVPHSLSLAWRLGRAVLDARQGKGDAVHAVAKAGGGCVVHSGTIVDVERRTSEGFARGHFIIMHEHAWPESGGMRIDFQNENLVARIGKHVLGCVPDLICCLETEGCHPVQTEDLRFGLRVTVVTLPAHPLLRTPEAMQVVGPAAFGYKDIAFHSQLVYKPVQPIPRNANANVG